METVIHSAESRGKASYDWLNTRYSFSFANYYNPERIHFGTLRVLNDDVIAGGTGFGMHPHDNMEIITIVLDGELRHTDSMKNTGIVHPGEVQVMSAGTGIFHSEYNNLPDKPLRLFQIWVFPDHKNIKPRYDQKFFEPSERQNKWQTIVAPDDTMALMINQKAWFNRVELSPGKSIEYKVHAENQGIYLFVISGNVKIDQQILENRDALGIKDAHSVSIMAESGADLLLMEIPMT